MRRVLCFGDSNTFGYDPRSYLGGRYPAETRWTGRLERAGWTVYNYGQNGLSIPWGPQLPACAALLRGAAPLNAVTVMLGSNDLLLGASPERAAAGMEAFLRCALDAAPGARVLLIAPPPMALGDWVPEEGLVRASRALAIRYHDLAQALDIPFADAGEWGVSLSFDGVHFSPEGHAAFAHRLSERLDALCPPPDSAP